jgi:hypothetical protein
MAEHPPHRVGTTSATEHACGQPTTRRGWRSAAAAALLASGLLGACGQPPGNTTPNAPATSEPAQAVPLMSAPCVKKVPTPYQWEGYNDHLRDACLGPTHYRIPANYFDDQMGPDFQASIALVVMWPDLQPAAPGKLRGQPIEVEATRVTISPRYVDRAPIDTLLDRAIQPSEAEALERDPSAILELRDRQPERFGLTPYFVNPDLFWKHEIDEAQRFGHKLRARLERQDDWYLHRDTQGRLTTVIKCDSHLEPDGYVIQDQRLWLDPTVKTAAGCVHSIIMEDVKASIRINYRRALLKDWKRFEDRAREIFEQYRVR